jgi:hypothetical protein
MVVPVAGMRSALIVDVEFDRDNMCFALLIHVRIPFLDIPHAWRYDRILSTVYVMR